MTEEELVLVTMIMYCVEILRVVKTDKHVVTLTTKFSNYIIQVGTKVSTVILIQKIFNNANIENFVLLLTIIHKLELKLFIMKGWMLNFICTYIKLFGVLLLNLMTDLLVFMHIIFKILEETQKKKNTKQKNVHIGILSQMI